MILVDTSIWIDHLRAADEALIALLEAGAALSHPFVIGELALGRLARRNLVLGLLQDLPQVVAATDGEVMAFIERNELAGLGIGYVDAHLLASVRLTAGASLWTRDKRLSTVADRLGLASPAH
jgi:predicted nucleic acid-binding protein